MSGKLVEVGGNNRSTFARAGARRGRDPPPEGPAHPQHNTVTAHYHRLVKVAQQWGASGGGEEEDPPLRHRQIAGTALEPLGTAARGNTACSRRHNGRWEVKTRGDWPIRSQVPHQASCGGWNAVQRPDVGGGARRALLRYGPLPRRKVGVSTNFNLHCTEGASTLSDYSSEGARRHL